MTAALEGGEWSAARPGRTLPPGKTQYPFYRRLGGLQGRSGKAENLVPTGIRSRTVQPVAQSLYRLSYRAHIINIYNIKIEDIRLVQWVGMCYFLFILWRQLLWRMEPLCLYIHILTFLYILCISVLDKRTLELVYRSITRLLILLNKQDFKSGFSMSTST